MAEYHQRYTPSMKGGRAKNLAGESYRDRMEESRLYKLMEDDKLEIKRSRISPAMALRYNAILKGSAWRWVIA